MAFKTEQERFFSAALLRAFTQIVSQMSIMTQGSSYLSTNTPLALVIRVVRSPLHLNNTPLWNLTFFAPTYDKGMVQWLMYPRRTPVC